MFKSSAIVLVLASAAFGIGNGVFAACSTATCKKIDAWVAAAGTCFGYDPKTCPMAAANIRVEDGMAMMVCVEDEESDPNSIRYLNCGTSNCTEKCVMEGPRPREATIVMIGTCTEITKIKDRNCVFGGT
jgi:hypothetical protein